MDFDLDFATSGCFDQEGNSLDAFENELLRDEKSGVQYQPNELVPESAGKACEPEVFVHQSREQLQLELFGEPISSESSESQPEVPESGIPPRPETPIQMKAHQLETFSGNEVRQQTTQPLAQKQLTPFHRRPVPQKPEVAAYKMEKSEIQSEMTRRQPQVRSRQPEAVCRQPEATRLQPQVTNLQPEAGSSQPETTNRQPEVTSHQPEAASRQPETKNRQLKVTSSQPEAICRQPEATRRQPKVSSHQPEAANPQPETTNRQLEVTSHHPEAICRQHETICRQQEMTRRQPLVTNRQPEVASRQPESTNRQPEVTRGTSASNQFEPKSMKSKSRKVLQPITNRQKKRKHHPSSSSDSSMNQNQKHAHHMRKRTKKLANFLDQLRSLVDVPHDTCQSQTLLQTVKHITNSQQENSRLLSHNRTLESENRLLKLRVSSLERKLAKVSER